MTASVMSKVIFLRLRGNGWSFRSDFARGLFFERSNFAQTSQVAFGLAELSREKSFDKVPGHHGSHDAATQTNDVHVIVLDTLPSREVIIDQSGASSRNLVGTDGSANPAAANRNPTLYRT